jgi:LytTr DNA-binding domain
LARRIAIEILVAVIIGALLGLLGPFETYRFNVGPRLAYWIFMIVAGLAIFRPTLIVSDWLAAETGMPRWAAGGVAIAIGSLPMTFLVAWLFNGFDIARALSSEGLPVFYGQVLLISLLTYATFRSVLGDRMTAEPATSPDVAPPSAQPRQIQSARFEARLPSGFGELLALSSEDHYVRAHGHQGTALILIRLRDAIGELDPAMEGMQIHRSWWVAQGAVAGRKSDRRAMRLVLVNGLEVPVSRERAAEVKSAGWI